MLEKSGGGHLSSGEVKQLINWGIDEDVQDVQDGEDEVNMELQRC